MRERGAGREGEGGGGGGGGGGKGGRRAHSRLTEGIKVPGDVSKGVIIAFRLICIAGLDRHIIIDGLPGSLQRHFFIRLTAFRAFAAGSERCRSTHILR